MGSLYGVVMGDYSPVESFASAAVRGASKVFIHPASEHINITSAAVVGPASVHLVSCWPMIAAYFRNMYLTVSLALFLFESSLPTNSKATLLCTPGQDHPLSRHPTRRTSTLLKTSTCSRRATTSKKTPDPMLLFIQSTAKVS